jgi:hypothetical protein
VSAELRERRFISITTTPRLVMNEKLKRRADLTVQSFAYTAGKLAQSPDPLAQSPLYEQILGEAEKHRSALRIMERDAFELANEGLRARTLSDVRAHRMRDITSRTIKAAHDSITRIASQFAPQRLAA